MKVVKKILKFIFSWGVVAFFAWVIYRNIGDYKVLANTIKNADFVLLAFGFLIALGNFAILTGIYRANYAIFSNTDKPLGKILPEMMVFFFIMIANPLGFTASAINLVKKLAKKGFSLVQATFSIFAMQLSVNLAFFPILATALWLLNSGNSLEQYEILASLALLGINILVIVIIGLLLFLPRKSLSIAKFIGKIVNYTSKPFTNITIFDSEKFENIIDQIQDASSDFDHNLKKYATSLLLSVLYHGFNLTALFLAFHTFNVAIPFTSLVTLYGIIVLFTVITPTAQGIGFVEGIAILIAISLKLPSEGATVSLLLYRVMVLWFPALFGMFVHKFHKDS